MENQLTRRGLSEREIVPQTAQMSFPVTAEISDAELQALLSEADVSIWRRPLPRQVEVATRIFSLIAIDAVSFMLAIWFSYWLRYESTFVTSHLSSETLIPLSHIAFPLLIWFPFLLLALKLSGMYDVKQRIQTLDKIPRIFGAVNAYIVSFLLLSFILDSPAMVRGFLVFFWVTSIVFILLGRTLLQMAMSFAGISDGVMRKTLIIGSGKVGKEVARKLLYHKGFGLIPIGFIDDE